MKRINNYIKVLATLNEQIDEITSNNEIPAVVVHENNGKLSYRDEVFGINCNHIAKVNSNKLELTKQGFEHYYLMGYISKNPEYHFLQVNDNTIWSIVSGILYAE